MRKKMMWVVLALVLVGILAGAGALYKTLSAEIMPGVPETSERTTEKAAPTSQTEAESVPPEAATTDNTTADSTESATQPKDTAPDFTVYTSDGSPVTLSSRFGKPLVVNFWASWCGPCRMELPHFDAAAKEYAGKIDFMMVNLTDGYSETVEGVQEFITSGGYTFPVYFDTQSEAAQTYGLYSIPVTLFIAADGTLQHAYTGAMDAQTLNGFLTEIAP